ncbi:unnamed protein product [Schistosoma mattheei]|uniref:Uncharacterized protein n=1 Tax=Schistosoma mattheei TaxID=31246 RepID=A0A183PSA5_9TREM|nr:unnamed protein product [Schistosoma mattheei]
MYTIGLESGPPNPMDGPAVSTNPVEAPNIRFSSSQFRKQHPRHEKVSRTSLVVAVYAWPCECISGSSDSPHPQSHQGI